MNRIKRWLFPKRPHERLRLSDDDARAAVKKIKADSNGAYATKICRNCLSFDAAPDGCAETALVVESCSNCFDETIRGREVKQVLSVINGGGPGPAGILREMDR